MELKDVVERFSLVSGFSSEKISRYMPVILDCIAFFKERMTGDYSIAERKRLSYACAVYAFYKISLCSEDEALSSFKAGDVQLSRVKHTDRAQKLWESERGEISSLVDLDSDSALLGVRV